VTGAWAAAVAGPLNHLLSAATWAADRLRRHAGKVISVEIGPVVCRYAIGPDAVLRPASEDATPDAFFRISPGLLARVLAGDRTGLHEVETSGDAALAADLAYIAEYLDWDAEEDLSRVVGDVASHRIVGLVRNADRWARTAWQNLGQSAQEYWTEEQPLVAKRLHVDRFVGEVDQLRDAVERLEKRVARLQRARVS
jgi:ubiquinone biosynthesis accessory factor UbiJ